MVGSAGSENIGKQLRILADTEKVAVISRDLDERWKGELSWKDVLRVIGYKKDCFTSDQIRFEFLGRDGVSVLASEDMEGWSHLVEILPKSLPGFPAQAEWFSKIAQPPFATNLTVLYERTTRD